MSIGVSYLGFRPDSGLTELLLTLVEAERDKAESIQFLSHWINEDSPPPWVKSNPLWTWAQGVLATDQTFASRHADLGTDFDMLHYLLSATRRAGKRQRLTDTTDVAFDDLVAQAIQDGTVLHPDLKCVQGHPVRIIAPETVADLAGCLEALAFADLRPRFDPVQMTARHVYKIHPNTEDWYVAHRLGELEKLFAEFRSFFMEARRRGEAILVFVD